MPRLSYPSWHLSTERVLNRGSTWVTSFLILGGREYFLSRAVLVLFFARSLPRSPSPSVLDNEAEYWCLGVGDGALWTGLSKRKKGQCWNSISFGLVNWIWSSVPGRRSRRWGVGGGALKRARIPFSPSPSQLFVAISLITSDVSFSDMVGLGKLKALFPVVSADIRQRSNNDVKKATRLIYNLFFSLFFLNPDCALGYWSYLIIIMISIISCLYVLYGTIITFSLWFFSFIYPSIVQNLYMNASTGVPKRKKYSMFSSFIWGNFHRLIINSTIHASIVLRLQYKVLRRLYELPLRPRKWNWGADFGSLLSASGKRLILDLWDKRILLERRG